MCFVGLKAHAFTGTAAAEDVAPTALGIRRLCFPALPGGANFCRAYGAPVDESRFSHRLVRCTLSPGRRDPSARRRGDSLGMPVDLPDSTHRRPGSPFDRIVNCQRAIRRSSREPGRTERPIDLPDSTGRRHWEPCHGGRKLPRLTLIYFGIAVYCGKYACR